MPNIAAIDIGSNAIRLIVANVGDDGGYQAVYQQREPLRLGGDVFKNGEISIASINKCKEVFAGFKKCLGEHNVKLMRAVATSALRDAKNQKEFVRQVSNASGIAIKVIPGLEEARLVNLAVSKKVILKDKLALLVDIGGGSVEVSLARNGSIVSTDSVNIGTVRFLQVLQKKQKGKDILERLLKSYAKRFRRRLKKYIGKKKIDILTATGGTVDNFGVIGMAHFNEKSDSKLSSKSLEEICGKLQALSVEERIKTFNLRPDRADVILPAAIIINQIVKLTGVSEIVLPGVGLKEGLLYDIISSRADLTSGRLNKQELVEVAKEIGRKFDYDEQHAELVSSLAVHLFDKLQKLHGLDRDHSILLELASLLHDVGSQINVESHHKHSYYIIRNSNFIGLNEAQKSVVACIARYHRKSAPKSNHPEFSVLSSKDKKAVKCLASILRIVEVISSDESIKPEGLKFYSKPGVVYMRISPRPDLILQKATLKIQTKPFEDFFKVRLLIR